MKILVAGGLHDDDQRKARGHFAAAIGRQIIQQGHSLLGGCRTALDAVVAEAAVEEARRLKRNERRAVHSWVTKSTKPSHDHGELTHSRLEDWSRVPRGATYPEPVADCDAMIIIGGWEGTHYAASWGRIAGRPLLPVATFGLAAREIFEQERNSFAARYASRTTMSDYQVLNRVLADRAPEALEEFAAEVVELATRMIASTEVFVIMPFAEKGHLKDAYKTFKDVCASKGFKAFKVDHHFDGQQRIVPNIFASIRRSAFVIAEVSDARPNVFYELGYARALGTPVIQTAHEGTELPFDVYDVPTLYWDCQDTLSRKLEPAIRDLKTTGL